MAVSFEQFRYIDSESGGRRVVTEVEANEVADRMIKDPHYRVPSVSVEHTFQHIVKVAHNRIIGSYSTSEPYLGYHLILGSGIQGIATTNVFEPQLLNRAIHETRRWDAPPIHPDDVKPEDPDSEDLTHSRAREILSTQVWYDTSVSALNGDALDVANMMIEQARRSDFMAFGTIALTQFSQLHKYTQGLYAYGEETDCEITMTARSRDGTTSGWFGQAHRDWGCLRPETIIEQTIRLAEQSKNMVGMEPGRRVAILSPFAVAQLIALLMPLFDAGDTNAGLTPFSYGPTNDGRTNRTGQKVFDERIQMSVDPQDSLGGYPAFTQRGMSSAAPVVGLPILKKAFVTSGVLQSLAYSPGEASLAGVHWTGGFNSVRVQATPGTTTMSEDEMIAQCEDGIYVNRLSDVVLLDPRTALMTGVTRDGCFHIRNGKINKPIKNFRFTDSPMFALNSLLAIGTPQRVPVTGAQSSSGEMPRTPAFPVICPPLMVQDFNFSALSEAI